MGTVLKFERPRKAVMESVLERAGALYVQRMQAEQELPRVLAAVAGAGLHDLVVRAVRSWGDGELDPSQVLEMVRTEAAVSGVCTVLG